MKSKRHTTEQIIGKLRRADIELGKGRKVPEVCKLLAITEQTYYRWRQKYGNRPRNHTLPGRFKNGPLLTCVTR